jgi:hypothetical protein
MPSGVNERGIRANRPFRRWLRESSSHERVLVGVGALLMLGLVVWAAVPTTH